MQRLIVSFHSADRVELSEDLLAQGCHKMIVRSLMKRISRRFEAEAKLNSSESGLFVDKTWVIL